MSDHAREVLRNLMFKETAVPTHDEKWFTVRIMPYRTFDDRIDGLVITLIDITKAKKMESELEKTIGVLREHNLLSNG
jgi:two-component system CheB/CheR fusion protein